MEMHEFLRAYVAGCLLTVCLSSKNGYRCSKEAVESLKKDMGGMGVYSVKIDDEIIWISDKEKKESGFKEVSVPLVSQLDDEYKEYQLDF